ncbi:hypothetical protein SpCBS45565_g01978 [Spizellomyces sp. 'palustris']|nr:hypothetical protein SpCBS45565_g01978 [Spizellomyces sp. 'palustris']
MAIIAPAKVNAKPVSFDSPPRPIFCYGTLMSAAVYCKVVGTASAPLSKPATLVGYRRRQVRGATYPAITPATADDKVEGLVVHVETHDQVRLLDLFESDDYERQTVRVHLAGEAVDVDVYVWASGDNLLSKEDWDFEDFLQNRLQEWLRDKEVFGDRPEDDQQEHPHGHHFVTAARELDRLRNTNSA